MFLPSRKWLSPRAFEPCRSNLEIVLHEGVDSVVSACRLPFPLGRPEQVVDADFHIAAEPPTVVQIPSEVSRPTACGHIVIFRVVHRVTEGKALLGRILPTQLQPATFAADFCASRCVDALPNPAPKIA